MFRASPSRARACVAAGLLLVLALPGSALATTLYGITAGDRLVTFDSTQPTTATSQPIAGLQPGETILGLDTRPRDGQMYGLGSTGRVYRISTGAVATAVLGPRTLPGGAIGFDIDAVRDRLRIVSASGLQVAIGFDGAEEALAAIAPAGVQVAGVAFDSNVYPASSALLLGVDVQSDRLVQIGAALTPTQEPGGTTTVRGDLGLDVTGQVGLDVSDESGMWMSAEVSSAPGSSRLYTVSLTTGEAILQGVIGAGSGMGVVAAITTPVQAAVRLTSATFSVSEGGGQVAIVVERSGATDREITVTLTTAGGTATPGSDYTAPSVLLTFAAGSVAPQTVPIPILQDGAIEGNETILVTLLPVQDFTVRIAQPGQAWVTIVDDDVQPPGTPTVAITTPTSDSSLSIRGLTTPLGGTAADADGSIVEVRWSTSTGLSGTAVGTTSWFVPEIPVPRAAITVTVTALDDAGLVATDTLVIGASDYAYFLAEGATGSFFSTDIAFVNPTGDYAFFDFTYLTETGAQVVQTWSAAPWRRVTIKADDIPELAATSFSTTATHRFSRYHPPGMLVVERTMRWSDGAQYGAHTEKATSLSRTWLFAEGAQGFFSTYLLLANPNPTANTATVDWLREGATPVRRTYTIAPTSRLTIDAGADPDLVGHAFGIAVQLSEPGMAERAMYFGADPLWTGGHQSAGVPFAHTEWFLAEGATGSFFTTFVLLANPGSAPVDVTLTGYRLGSTPVTATYTVPANGRRSINLATIPGLENAAVSTRVVASGPIVAERAQYWPGLPSQWQEAHNAFGLTTTGRRWGLAEGRVGNPPQFPPADYQTYILLANPGSLAASVTIRFLREDADTLVKTFTVPPESRFNVRITGPDAAAADNVPDLVDTTFGALVESDRPIAVERAMYANAGGIVWAAGTNSTATRLP